MGNEINGSVRSTTAGVQLTPNIGYSFIRRIQHEFQVSIGPLARYQSSSLADVTSISYPPITNFPFPVVDFIQLEKMRTFAAGFNIQASYHYSINNKINIGVIAGFQADTQGDNLSHTSLSAGYRF